MFGKRAVIITQCLGAGEKSTVKDIKDSLSWWGISYIKTCGFKLMSDINWEKIPEKKRNKMTSKLKVLVEKMRKIAIADLHMQTFLRNSSFIWFA